MDTLLKVLLGVLLSACPAWAGSFADDFNRPDSTELNANWDPETTFPMKIVRQAVQGQLLASANEEITNQGTPTADQYARVRIKTFTSGAVYGDARALVRATVPATAREYYGCFAEKNTTVTSEIFVRTIAGGVISLVSENATTWAAGDLLECRAEGSTISLWRISGGVARRVLVVANTALPTGRVGMGSRDDGSLDNVEIDDFIGGDYPYPVARSLTGAGS